MTAIACAGCGSTSRDADETNTAAGAGGGTSSGGAGSGGGAGAGGMTSVGGGANAGGASEAGSGGAGAGGASDGGAAGSSAGQGGATAAEVIRCAMRQGLPALLADPETRSTIEGSNGTFTDECDADGNLVEYTCPMTLICGPGMMDCAPYPTGQVGSFVIDCNGQCHDGICDG